jgi:hypothetical protein
MRTFGEAMKTIDPKKANHGLLSDIWLAWAKLYISHTDYPNANMVLF